MVSPPVLRSLSIAQVLEGYRYAATLAPALQSRLVYMVEEDIWVARDFFVYHRAVHDSMSEQGIQAARFRQVARCCAAIGGSA